MLQFTEWLDRVVVLAFMPLHRGVWMEERKKGNREWLRGSLVPRPELFIVIAFCVANDFHNTFQLFLLWISLSNFPIFHREDLFRDSHFEALIKLSINCVPSFSHRLRLLFSSLSFKSNFYPLTVFRDLTPATIFINPFYREKKYLSIFSFRF